VAPEETNISNKEEPPVTVPDHDAAQRSEGAFQRRLRLCLVLALMALAGIAVAACVCLNHYVYTPMDEGGAAEVYVIRPGSGLTAVVRDLETEGLLRRALPVRVWASVKGYGGRIRAGEYLLSRSWSPARILEAFVQGSVIQHSVTIPEGYTVDQIAGLLQERDITEKRAFLALARDPELIRGYGLQGETLEGYLFPDTYLFSRDTPPRMVLDRMVGRFKEVAGPLQEAIDARGLSLHEVVTLASIVEKETGAAQERPLIAGVFLNRLERNMRLESDPTVIYGLKDFDGNLTRAHLGEPHAFNTYVIPGLPPGPIANPGGASIRAVLYPAQTSFLYFVSRNDGTHHFSKTYSEHVRAVARYQRAGRRTS